MGHLELFFPKPQAWRKWHYAVFKFLWSDAYNWSQVVLENWDCSKPACCIV